MFTPASFGRALGMMIATAICWGSWANTYKGVKDYRFELFYWDYAIGIFLFSLAYAFTLGSSGHDAWSFASNVQTADVSNIGWAVLAGVIFNLANLLLVAGIDMAGLAMAFPVSIGIALVVGVVLSYAQQPRGGVGMLSAGVICAIVAVVLDGKAYGQLSAGRAISRKSIAVCVISGVLMGLWAPFSTRALTHGHALSPYAVVVFLTLGGLGSCFVWNVYFMRKPLRGEPVGFGGFFRAPASAHILGLLGGLVWTTGTVFSLVAASYTGVATSYAIGQSAPMVAALWGIFAWKEFRGANSRAKAFLILMFLFYVLAILLVARAITAS
ncbi:MAG TPA: GRP family sugar transporter [Candidatus Cybelea sp.]|nr:GRP family sugar transporter [Candidatus Cybelea sp.]